jgi:hypothetical protein
MTRPVRDLVRPAHKAVARLVGMALSLHERLGYAHLARGLVQHLTPEECHGLAWAALHACAPQKAWAIASQRLAGHEGAGPPEEPAWLRGMDPAWIMHDAMHWARDANEFERRAYAMACLAHMTEEERHALVRQMDRRDAG